MIGTIDSIMALHIIFTLIWLVALIRLAWKHKTCVNIVLFSVYAVGFVVFNHPLWGILKGYPVYSTDAAAMLYLQIIALIQLWFMYHGIITNRQSCTYY